MILKSITINGFKSFAKKVVIDVSHNVTGVVGPNGSGKSNIAEAVRFVMGEQSMKSIRSRNMSDLVYKGSNYINAMSRASVMVEIDNKEKKYNEGVSPELAQFLAYDTIVLSREVYLDGNSAYKINDAVVRLKDVQSLLSLAGIGASAHTIISQGEADKILLANPKERKEMIEDALGLKIHQIRLKDSDKKIKKVNDHLHSIELMRRELAPELNHLRIQMEKVNRIEEERDRLRNLYLNFFVYETNDISRVKNNLNLDSNIQEKIDNIKVKLLELKAQEHSLNDNSNREEYNKKKNIVLDERFALEKELSVLQYEKSRIVHELNSEVKDLKINKDEFVNFRQELNNLVLNVEINLQNQNLLLANENIKSIKSSIEASSKWLGNLIDRNALRSKIEDIENKEKNILSKISEVKNKISVLEKEESDKMSGVKELYSHIYNLEKEINTLESRKRNQEFAIENLNRREEELNFTMNEAVRFVGHDVVVKYKSHTLENNWNNSDARRQIEKIKLRIEDAGVIDPIGIRNSFEELTERDVYLLKEIEDLTKTRESLSKLIAELNVIINNDFHKGVEKINFAFINFFNNIFPGGKAEIFLAKEEKSDDHSDSESEIDVYGVGININLPGKKITDINLLSGGEKTLSSIALLFALTSITPPPFMVLDETDAALDEMNARKYGKMLSKLAEKSRLLVITHNRETMNECDVLYGITMGTDGASKILSLKFDK